ncbi:hypothetical protein [Lysinibacillus sphaericus]
MKGGEPYVRQKNCEGENSRVALVALLLLPSGVLAVSHKAI